MPSSMTRSTRPRRRRSRATPDATAIEFMTHTIGQVAAVVAVGSRGQVVGATGCRSTPRRRCRRRSGSSPDRRAGTGARPRPRRPAAGRSGPAGGCGGSRRGAARPARRRSATRRSARSGTSRTPPGSSSSRDRARRRMWRGAGGRGGRRAGGRAIGRGGRGAVVPARVQIRGCRRLRVGVRIGRVDAVGGGERGGARAVVEQQRRAAGQDLGGAASGEHVRRVFSRRAAARRGPCDRMAVLLP